MKIPYQVVGVTGVCAALFLFTAGCDAPDAGSGANEGGFFASIIGPVMSAAGVPASTVNLTTSSMVLAGAVMGQINADQLAQLRAQSPQTVTVIERNDQVAASQTTEPVLPLSLSDIEALVSVGVNPPVIVSEIHEASTANSYTQQDVDSLRQAYPNVDPTITQAML
jgi:hypothetical protein